MAMHEALEAELAAFKGTPAVLTFQSGFTANTGVIPTVTGETDLIVSDALNHASIIDGMRLSKAPRKIYPHADVEALRDDPGRGPASAAATATARPYRLILVVTDGVFSMDGDIAPLPGIVEAAEAFGAAVMVDDAHASGVLGRNGRGTVDHFGLHGRVDIQVGTLSKAVGSLGGYVAGSLALREILTQRARPFLFSTSHPPAVVAACREAIRVMEEEPELQERLWANTRRFKAELTRLGFDTGRSETPITPVMMGDPDTAGRFSGRLHGGGRLRPAGRLPDRGHRQVAPPDDRHRRPRRRPARPGAGGVRHGRPRTGPDRRVSRSARPATCRSMPISTPTSRPTATSRSTTTPRQAVERGIAELAITDHVDFRPGATGLLASRRSSSASARSATPPSAGRRRAWPSGSAPSSRYERDLRGRTSASTSRRHAYDFVIGSVHIARRLAVSCRAAWPAWVAGRSLAEIVEPYYVEVEAAARSGTVRHARPHRLRQALPRART